MKERMEELFAGLRDLEDEALRLVDEALGEIDKLRAVNESLERQLAGALRQPASVLRHSPIGRYQSVPVALDDDGARIYEKTCRVKGCGNTFTSKQRGPKMCEACRVKAEQDALERGRQTIQARRSEKLA